MFFSVFWRFWISSSDPQIGLHSVHVGDPLGESAQLCIHLHTGHGHVEHVDVHHCAYELLNAQRWALVIQTQLAGQKVKQIWKVEGAETFVVIAGSFDPGAVDVNKSLHVKRLLQLLGEFPEIFVLFQLLLLFFATTVSQV